MANPKHQRLNENPDEVPNSFVNPSFQATRSTSQNKTNNIIKKILIICAFAFLNVGFYLILFPHLKESPQFQTD